MTRFEESSLNGFAFGLLLYLSVMSLILGILIFEGHQERMHLMQKHQAFTQQEQITHLLQHLKVEGR